MWKSSQYDQISVLSCLRKTGCLITANGAFDDKILLPLDFEADPFTTGNVPVPLPRPEPEDVLPESDEDDSDDDIDIMGEEENPNDEDRIIIYIF